MAAGRFPGPGARPRRPGLDGSWPPVFAPPASEKLADTAAAIVKEQNEVGAWVEPAKANIQGKMEEGIPALYSDTFTRNILTLARFIAAK